MYRGNQTHRTSPLALTAAIKKFGDVIDKRTVDSWIGKLTREGYVVLNYDGERGEHFFEIQPRVIIEEGELCR